MRRLLLTCALASVLLPEARATWSVVVVNMATREVAVACATCIENVDLLPELPALRPGLGAGNVQAWWDNDGSRRLRMWEGFGAGETPAQILADLRNPSFQYGIVSVAGAPVTYTGGNAMDGVCGVAGEAGDLRYAIQGNVIAGEAVCLAAEQALLGAQGDTVARVMAAMEAARAMGGDGRCSCSFSDPDGCGTPPPGQWKSAHTAFVAVARVGDPDGPCEPDGCPDGPLYLARTIVGDAGDIDPILALAGEVASWRDKQRGRPDHLLSEVLVDRQRLVADGATAAHVTVVLRDIDGTPLTSGGALLTVEPTGEDVASVGAVQDHGDGTYSFDLSATGLPGRGQWNVVVDFGGNRPRQLYPPLALVSDPPVDLHCGAWTVSAAAPQPVPLTLSRGAAEGGRAYHLLLSAAGTWPGIDVGSVWLPLNRDALLVEAWRTPLPPVFDGFVGALDVDGRAHAWLDLPAATLAALVGERIDLCALLGAPPTATTALAAFWIVP